MIGYGCRITGISDESFFGFMQKYAPGDIKKMAGFYFGHKAAEQIDRLSKEEIDLLQVQSKEWAGTWTLSGASNIAEYTADIICRHTCDGLFAGAGREFVIYQRPMFPDDDTADKRKFVRNAKDVETILSSFFPEDRIKSGPVYVGINITSGHIHVDGRTVAPGEKFYYM